MSSTKASGGRDDDRSPSLAPPSGKARKVVRPSPRRMSYRKEPLELGTERKQVLLLLLRATKLFRQVWVKFPHYCLTSPLGREFIHDNSIFYYSLIGGFSPLNFKIYPAF